METGHDIWAIILNFRGADMTKRCVASVLRSNVQPHILVVDNGSPEEEWKELQEAFRDRASVQATQTGTNLGYAGGMQWGIRLAAEIGPEFVWLLNNDCEVRPDSLGLLLREMLDHPDTGTCSGIVIHPKPPHNAGSTLDLIRGRVIPLNSTERMNLPRYEVDFVPGHAWLLRMSVIRRIGGLDCRLFLQGEEPDWCHRARMAGFRSIVIPAAAVDAQASATARRYPCELLYLGIRNTTWLVRRRASLLMRMLHYVVLVGFRLPKGAGGLLARGRLACMPWLLRGVWEGLARSPHWSDKPAAALRSRPATMV